jgi:hypothetical protein
MPRRSKGDSNQGLRPDSAPSKIRSTYPQGNPLLYSRALGVICLCANLCTQIICAFTISQYDPTHSNRELGRVGRLLGMKNIDTGLEGINRVPDSQISQNWSLSQLKVRYLPTARDVNLLTCVIQGKILHPWSHTSQLSLRSLRVDVRQRIYAICLSGVDFLQYKKGQSISGVFCCRWIAAWHC